MKSHANVAMPKASTKNKKTTMVTQPNTETIEIVGLELLHIAELESLIESIENMSFSSSDHHSDNGTYANDSLNLERVTAGARRRGSPKRHIVNDSYSVDSVELTRRFRQTSLVEGGSVKDCLPTEMIFMPLKSEPQVSGSKELQSTHLGAKDMTKLRPHSLTNCAA